MTIKTTQELEGTRIPAVTLVTRRDGDWYPLRTDEFFAGRTVIVFALPGAFTPTCSTSHLPRYDELAPVLREHGVDEIVCLSVNDAFVMEAWADQQGTENITFLPDGNGDLSRALGMLVDKRDLGFGPRSWRYSMLVRDGVIDKAFIEPQKPGDPFEVSDADTMLGYLAPQASTPPEVTIFTKPGCQFCARAKQMLHDHGLRFEEIELGGGVSYSTLHNVTGRRTAPQIYIDGTHVDGLDGLERYFAERAPGSEPVAAQ